ERPRGGFVAVRDLPVQAGLELVFACRVLVEDLPVAAYRHVGQGAQVAHVEGDQKVPGLEVGGGGDQGGEPVGGLGDVPDFGVDAGGGRARGGDGGGGGDGGRGGGGAGVGCDTGRGDAGRRLHYVRFGGGVHVGDGGRDRDREPETRARQDGPGRRPVGVGGRRGRRESPIPARDGRVAVAVGVRAGRLGEPCRRSEGAGGALPVRSGEPDLQIVVASRGDARGGDRRPGARRGRRRRRRYRAALNSEHVGDAVAIGRLRQRVRGRLRRRGGLHPQLAAHVAGGVHREQLRPPAGGGHVEGVADVRALDEDQHVALGHTGRAGDAVGGGRRGGGGA